MSSEKQLWLLAGGNGAGKSTFYRLFLAPRGIPFVNADLIAPSLDRQQPEAASYEAARLAERLRTDLLQKGSTFCFETVFSHPSKIDFIAEAKANGYEVILVFIHLPLDELNQARVAQRVSEGGHNVPAEKIINRIPRTLQYVRKALPLVDTALLFDNGSEASPFSPVAQLRNGELTIAADPVPAWAGELLSKYL